MEALQLTEKKAVTSLIDNFNTAVLKIRNIILKEGYSCEISLIHTCLYVISRFINLKVAKAMGIPDKFAWENIMQVLHKKGDGAQKAFELFCSPSEECLINYIDRFFGTREFSFKLNKVKTHKQILEILNKVDIHEVEKETEILGWVYETFLKYDKGTSKGLGQYFTNRSICKYMTKLVEPKLNALGEPEIVCDPSMGTGGFLTSYIKFYKDNYPNQKIDWSKHQEKIHGVELNDATSAIAQMNFFIEANGNLATNLRTGDSLKSGLDNNQFDIILGNMPFGLGVDYDECAERIKALNIGGGKSDTAFLQLMMLSLKKGGRCAVVVSDGTLTTNGAFMKTREHLLNNYELKRVIKMKGRQFVNTGAQASILFFENTGNPTTNVEFWEVEKDEMNQITEKMVLSIPREKIDESCSLDYRRYEEKPILPKKYESFILDSIIFKNGSGKTNSTSITNTGEYPFYGCTNVVPSGTHSSYDFDAPNYLLFAKSGGNAKNPISSTLGIGKFHHVKGKSSGNIAIYQYMIRSEFLDKVSYEFLTYSLAYHLPQIQSFANYTTGNGNINVDLMLKTVEIMVPPRPVQDEIVDKLDRIYNPGMTELSENIKISTQQLNAIMAHPQFAAWEPLLQLQQSLQKSAQAVKNAPQQKIDDIKFRMKEIVTASNRLNFEKKAIFDVMNVLSGKGNPNLSDCHQPPFVIPYYKSNGVAAYVETSLFDGEYIVTARTLSIGSVHYVNGPFYPSDNTINFTTRDHLIINNKFFYYWLLFNNHILKNMATGVKNLIRKSDVERIQIPVPPINFQIDVLKRLEPLQRELNTLEEIQKQNDNDARFIMESYLVGSNEQHIEVQSADEFPVEEAIPIEEQLSQNPTPSPKPCKIKVIG
jgi:restriction endonuclease S subunit